RQILTASGGSREPTGESDHTGEHAAAAPEEDAGKAESGPPTADGGEIMHMSPSTRAAARCLRALTVLTMIALMAVPMTAQANPLWCSPFETEGGVPVTNNKVADVVDNNVGAPGQATGNLA